MRKESGINPGVIREQSGNNPGAIREYSGTINPGAPIYESTTLQTYECTKTPIKSESYLENTIRAKAIRGQSEQSGGNPKAIREQSGTNPKAIREHAGSTAGAIPNKSGSNLGASWRHEACGSWRLALVCPLLPPVDRSRR